MKSKSVPGRRRMLGVSAGVAALSTFGSRMAHATALPIVNAVGTNVTSNVDRMISYRFQERTWQTPDGGTHMVVNRGTLPSKGALVLSSSYDNGVSWSAATVISNTDYTSTVDGFLNGNLLTVVYSTTDQRIQQGLYVYDPTLKRWTRSTTLTVYYNPTVVAYSPSIEMDAVGALWCCYVTEDKATLSTVIRLSFRSRLGGPWGDTTLQFGTTDNLPGERAGRLVRVPGGVGMVYTWHDDIYWASRLDGAPIVSPWTTTLLWRSDPPGSGGRGAWGGHFSVIKTPDGNAHMATVDAGRLVYFRYIAATGQWNPINVLSVDFAASYTQITLCEGKLLIVVNSQSQAMAIQSDNLGDSFYAIASLKHPPPTTGQSYSEPRLESPGVSRNPVPVLQQYTDGTLLKLMQFSVPLSGV